MIAHCPQTRESVPLGARPPTLAQSPTAQPRQEALRNLGSAVMGGRKTGPEGGLEQGKRKQRGLFPVKTSARKR